MSESHTAEGLIAQIVAANVVQRVVDDIFADPARVLALREAVAHAVVQRVADEAFGSHESSGWKAVVNNLSRDQALISRITGLVKDRLDVAKIAESITRRTMDDYARRY